MFMRALETAESMVVLRRLGNEADALALARVLFEHVVMYAWLMVDPRPPERFRRWWQRDNREDRTRIRELARLRQATVEESSPVFRDQPQWAGLPPLRGLQQLAREADGDSHARVAEAIGWPRLEDVRAVLDAYPPTEPSGRAGSSP